MTVLNHSLVLPMGMPARDMEWAKTSERLVLKLEGGTCSRYVEVVARKYSVMALPILVLAGSNITRNWADD